MFYAQLEQADTQSCKRIQVKELIFKQDFPLFSRHSGTDFKVVILLPILLTLQSYTQRILDLKEKLWIPLRDNACIYVASVPERLRVLCISQKPTDTEIRGSGVLTFLFACTCYGNTITVKSLNLHSISNTEKDIN